MLALALICILSLALLAYRQASKQALQTVPIKSTKNWSGQRAAWPKRNTYR